MLRFRTGDILESKAQTLVNTVNCVGVMGKGVALEFKRHFPQMYRDYVRRCKAREVHPGEPYVFSTNGRQIVNFPTKDHWRRGSRLSYVESGLDALRTHNVEWHIRSLAVPALGCGNGGLDWSDVKPLIERYLGDLSIEIEIYEPSSRKNVSLGVADPVRNENGDDVEDQRGYQRVVEAAPARRESSDRFVPVDGRWSADRRDGTSNVHERNASA